MREVMKEKAVEYYHGKENYNCAQAVMKACCALCSEEDISRLTGMGGGRAEGGLCGALYAANKLLSGEDKKKMLVDKFREAAGSEKCREIKKLKKA